LDPHAKKKRRKRKESGTEEKQTKRGEQGRIGKRKKS
jgi:hypothetical protein